MDRQRRRRRQRLDAVEIVLPLNVDYKSALSSLSAGPGSPIESTTRTIEVSTKEEECFSKPETPGGVPCFRRNVVVLRCLKPGIAWRGLHPLLFNSSEHAALNAVRWLLRNVCKVDLIANGLILADCRNPIEEWNTEDGSFLGGTGGEKNAKKHHHHYCRRKLLLRQITKACANNGNNRCNHNEQHDVVDEEYPALTLWVEPPSITNDNNWHFTKALIKWEHQLIVYQSLAAWCSTLGGGYFLCRHLTTAVELAKQQHFLAILMGDTKMAMQCYIHQAYSYIHAGKFDLATKTINSILAIHKRDPLPKKRNIGNENPITANPRAISTTLDPVIIQMCRSAKLFCQRVKKASEKLANSEYIPPQHKQSLSEKVEVSSVVDNYQRIRIVKDKSVPRPFSLQLQHL